MKGKHVSYVAVIAGIAGAIYFGIAGDWQHAGECAAGLVALFMTPPTKAAP